MDKLLTYMYYHCFSAKVVNFQGFVYQYIMNGHHVVSLSLISHINQGIIDIARLIMDPSRSAGG